MLLGVCWFFIFWQKTEFSAQGQTAQWETLTVPSPTCRFSSFQTALSRSYCKRKRDNRVHVKTLADSETNGRPPTSKGRNLRLWLSRVVAQGHTVALDLVKTLLAEVIPVGNKAIFR